MYPSYIFYGFCRFSEKILDFTMKSTLNGIKFFGYFTLIAIVLLKCSFAKRENKLSGDPKFDVVADEVKETKQKSK